jgi:hypothetical protein
MPTIRHGTLVVALPPGWEDQTQIVAAGPAARHGFRPNVVISFDKPDEQEELDHFVRRRIVDLKRSLSDFRLTSEGFMNYGRHVGYQIEYTFNANDLVIQQVQFYSFIGSQAWFLTYSDISPVFELERNVIEEVISGIVFIEESK